jgi:hypothetical protein
VKAIRFQEENSKESILIEEKQLKKIYPETKSMTSLEHLKQMDTNIIEDDLEQEGSSKIGESEDAQS